MTCEQIREAASARLDGETVGVPSAVLDDHLRHCTACAQWLARATAVTRTARMGSVVVPDLSEQIMAAVELPQPRRTASRLLRGALAVLGLVQVALAVPAVFGDSMGMAMSMHSAHESAAWNAALGAAFLLVALRPRQAAALVPVTGVFVLFLAALSVHDVVVGDVGVDRLLTHLACVLGVFVLAALARVTGSEGTAPAPASVDGTAEATTPPLRGVA